MDRALPGPVPTASRPVADERAPLASGATSRDEYGGEHREIRLVGETQAVKAGRLEPRRSVVLVWRGVDGCSGSPVDQPDLPVERRGADLMHRRTGRLRCRDSQLLPKLADEALFRILPLLNVTARQVPHVGIPTASGASDPCGSAAGGIIGGLVAGRPTLSPHLWSDLQMSSHQSPSWLNFASWPSALPR
jgi:hypothetical protein